MRIEARLKKLEDECPKADIRHFMSLERADGSIQWIRGAAEELAECEANGTEISFFRLIGVKAKKRDKEVIQ
jgi:hypothetical protein